ncbi:hypothetical protein MKX03_015564 [Papaver bracteatum]|nr:hypothetical protein MKX03_015564 [Papaver bracteatum]
MGETLGEMIHNLDLESGDPYRESVRQEPCKTIFKVPNYIKERNRTAYEPKMVSIGPYYHGREDLIPMQVHKKRALVHFFGRNRAVPIESYLTKLTENVTELRASYEQHDLMQIWEDDDSFVQLMLVDGSVDPIFGERGHALIYNPVKQDLLLLENQLPYRVPFILLSVSGREADVNRSLSWMMSGPRTGSGCHFLDMYMKGLLVGSDLQNQDLLVAVGCDLQNQDPRINVFGVQFRTVGSYNEIAFVRETATLKLPRFEINENSISTYLNLKAYEHRGGTNIKELSSYIRLLNTLVHSANDVSFLRSRGIIISSLASDEAVVKVMKDLPKGTILLDDMKSHSCVLTDVNKYVEKRPKWSWLLSYWRSILGAATLLLVLTLLQTIYSILSFHIR